MTTLTVTTVSDETFNGGTLADELADGNGLSLREAIALANDADGEDEIIFDATVFTGGADSLIRLTQGELVITDDVTIDGSTVRMSPSQAMPIAMMRSWQEQILPTSQITRTHWTIAASLTLPLVE